MSCVAILRKPRENCEYCKVRFLDDCHKFWREANPIHYPPRGEYIHGKRVAIVLKLNRRRFVTHPTFLQNGLAAGLKLAPISISYILPRLFAPSTIPCSFATNLGCFTTSDYIISIFLFQSIWPTVKQSQTSRIMGDSVQY